MNKQRILIVDASPLIYACEATTGMLAIQGGEHKGERTGLRYGFLRAVRKYAETTKADKTVIVYDATGPVTKAQGLDGYKSNRTNSPEKQKMFAQVPALKDLISLTGWAQAEAPGYEADDVAGTIALRLAEQDHLAVILSTDNDFCQLINDHITVLAPGKTPTYKDVKYVKENFSGCEPRVLLPFRAFVGDKSDTVRGLVSGSANETKAAEVLNANWWDHKLMDFEQQIEYYFGILTNAKFTSPFPEIRTVEDRLTFGRNMKVMRLTAPPSIDLKKGAKDRELLAKEFERLEFKSLMKTIDDYLT